MTLLNRIHEKSKEITIINGIGVFNFIDGEITITRDETSDGKIWQN